VRESVEAGPSDPLVADLTRPRLHEIHHALVLARSAEERLELLFRQGHVTGGLYRSLGQEAGAVGAAYALRRRDDGTGDVVAQTIRATGAVFLMGGTPLQYFRQYLARATAPTRGKEANVHWCDFRRGLVGPVSPLGSMVEVMAGITLAFRMRGEDRVGVVFAGDGASSTGAWHEGLNFAAVRRCPMVLVVEANRWAFSTPTRKQSRVASFVEKCAGYGIGGVSVDGVDVLAVYEATREAVHRARSGEGVQMVELRYCRRLGHAQHDPHEYMDPEELAHWAERDPVDAYRARLVANGWASEGELVAIESAAHASVVRAAERVLEEPRPRGRDALEGVWGDIALEEPWWRSEDTPRGIHTVPAPDGVPFIDPFRRGAGE
jgi:TPP-dependent pyruvate/acetoin dehydrogenase alpha subunit